MELEMQLMQIKHVPRVFDLERSSYPSDEAASLETIEYRASVTSGLCQVACNASTKEIVGFVTATAAPENTERMTASMMKYHCPSGRVVCIHSVVIDSRFRRKGLGKKMLLAYVDILKSMPQYNRVLLIAKQYLIRFYESVGFTVIGESSISHGKDPWIEMAMPTLV